MDHTGMPIGVKVHDYAQAISVKSLRAELVLRKTLVRWAAVINRIPMPLLWKKQHQQ